MVEQEKIAISRQWCGKHVSASIIQHLLKACSWGFIG
jgi:hypothetical protein